MRSKSKKVRAVNKRRYSSTIRALRATVRKNKRCFRRARRCGRARRVARILSRRARVYRRRMRSKSRKVRAANARKYRRTIRSLRRTIRRNRRCFRGRARCGRARRSVRILSRRARIYRRRMRSKSKKVRSINRRRYSRTVRALRRTIRRNRRCFRGRGKCGKARRTVRILARRARIYRRRMRSKSKKVRAVNKRRYSSTIRALRATVRKNKRCFRRARRCGKARRVARVLSRRARVYRRRMRSRSRRVRAVSRRKYRRTVRALRRTIRRNRRCFRRRARCGRARRAARILRRRARTYRRRMRSRSRRVRAVSRRRYRRTVRALRRTIRRNRRCFRSKRRCRRGYKLVYKLARYGRRSRLRLRATCVRARTPRCRYPTALFYGRCRRRCPSGFVRRSRVSRGLRLGVCRPTRRTRLCRRRRCRRGRVCRVVRRRRLVRRGRKTFRRVSYRAACAPKYCRGGRSRFRGRCVRRCPSGFVRRSRRRGSKTVRSCARKLCRYPLARLGRRCVRSCPTKLEKKVFAVSRRRFAVCRRSLCSRVRCAAGQRCVMRSLARRRRVAECRDTGSRRNPCSRVVCRRGTRCALRRSRRRGASPKAFCRPTVPLCRRGLVSFAGRCRRRCPRRYRVLATKTGKRLYRRCVRDACSRKRFFLHDRCTRRCPRGFRARTRRYSRGYSFRYCEPKGCRGRRFRIGRRCVRRCPSGFRRRYFRVRRSVRRYCLSYICKKGFYKLGRRCVRSCGKSRVKKTFRKGRRTYGVCVAKKCRRGTVFVRGRCRKPLKGCYDRSRSCKALARRKRCSRKLVSYICPAACGKCDPKKRKMCTCTSMGDPHYRTFDGKWINFMGRCKYLLAKSSLSKSSKCNFEVTAKNELRGKKRSVSWTRFVDISFHGVRIRLHQKRRVFINGKLVKKLPVSIYKKGKKVRVYRSGKKVVAESKFCGLYLEFNGRSVAELHVPKSRFAGRVSGICGNCNGKASDDLRTRAGKDVSKEGRRGLAKLGQSFAVPDDSSKKYKCKVRPAKDVCSKAMRAKVTGRRFCGLLKDKKGPFGACLRSGKVKNAVQLFKNCRFDVCEYKSRRNRNRAVCESLEALYDACLAAGFRVKWRSRKFCPMRCRRNSVFVARASGCPRTCADIGRRRKCRLPSREACACKSGFVLDGRRCVREAKCGKVAPIDIAFVLEATDDVSPKEFDAMKSLVVKLLTRYRVAGNSVRPGLVAFGRLSPTVRLLSASPDKSAFMQFVRKLRKRGGSADNLAPALRAVSRVVLHPAGGARPSAPKVVVIVTKTPPPASAASELARLKRQKVRVLVVQVPSSGKKPATGATSGGAVVIPARMPPFRAIPKIVKAIGSVSGCPAGFRVVRGGCADVNECRAKPRPCHADSTCVNLPGRYVCLCPAGLRHDRKRGCVKPNAAKPKCPAKPKCSRGYAYSQKAKKCVDINECKENPCLGEDATCVNTLGSFKCECRKGYRYSKHFGCVDVDECKTKKRPCSGAGKCVNTVGSYKCACDSGYEYGEDAGCKDVDECKAGKHECKGGAKCSNTEGSYKCVCDEGYRYLKDRCADINECAENSTLCDASATCVNTNPGYKCQCNLGNNWVHVPGKGCVPDKTKGYKTRKVNFYFMIDGSDQLKDSLKDIKLFMTRLLDLFARKEVPGLNARATAIVVGNGKAEVQFGDQPLPSLSPKINAISAPGGEPNILAGFQAAEAQRAKTRKEATQVFFLITSSSVKSGDKNLPSIRKLADSFKTTGQLYTLHISPTAKPSEWTNLYAGQEISKFVTVIRSAYLETIAKLVYRRMYPLIACPHGFIKVDGLCKLQTKAMRYCKTDSGELRPEGSTWEEECSQFKCTGAGVQVLSRKCLGYDGVCYSTEEFFPCTQVTGKLSWRCRCKLRTAVDKRTGKKTEFLHYQSIAFKAEKILTDKKRPCVFPFKYRSKWYYNCESFSGRYWCSFGHYHRQGHWGYCQIKSSKNKCTDPFDSSKVYVEGDRWNHGCNVMECTPTGMKRTPKCKAADGTCKKLNVDDYACKIDGKQYSNCLCVQDSAGWGKNQRVSGDKAKVVTGGGGSVVSVCIDGKSGNKYEKGQKWTSSCFEYECTTSGGKLLKASCEGADGTCQKFGATGFSCNINGARYSNCSCGKDDKGNPQVSTVKAGKTYKEVRVKSEVKTSIKKMALKTNKTVLKK